MEKKNPLDRLPQMIEEGGCDLRDIAVGDFAIPNGVKKIGVLAFSWCENLTSISIPDSVTAIGDNVFTCCENLDSITIRGSKEKVEQLLHGKLKSEKIETCSFDELRFTRENNGFVKGLVLNRDLTVDECRHIVSELLGIEIQEEDDFYDDEQDVWIEYNKDLQRNVNGWLRGDADDECIAEYMYDCRYDQLGMMQMIGILMYLKSIEAI